MSALLRRVDYHARPRARRETCKRCWRENPVGFSVSDGIWKDVVPARRRHQVLCVFCFDRYAVRRGIDWAATPCDWFPVSGTRSGAVVRLLLGQALVAELARRGLGVARVVVRRGPVRAVRALVPRVVALASTPVVSHRNPPF